MSRIHCNTVFARVSLQLDVPFIFCAASRADTDPVCSLTNANKLRLCVSLFGVRHFQDKGFKFVPTMASVLTECTMKDITFLNPGSVPFIGRYTSSYISPLRRYREWMIGCKATTRQGDPIIYYISRSRRPNRAFLFQETGVDGRVAPYNMLANIAVIDGRRANAPQSFLRDDIED